MTGEQIPTLPKLSSTLVRKRWLFMILAFCFAVMVAVYAYFATWSAPAHLTAVLLWVMTLTTVLISAQCLIRYFSQRQGIFLLTGVAFIAASCLHGYHAFISSRFIDLDLPIPTPQIGTSSLYIAGLFTVLPLLFSPVFTARAQTGPNFTLTPIALYALTVFIVLLAILATFVLPLPKPFYIEQAITRPHELLLGALFFAVIIIYLRDDRWRTYPYEFGAIICFILLFASHVMVLSFARQINDEQFVFTLVLQVIAYLFMSVGLLRSSYRLFVLSVQREKVLEKLNIELSVEKQRTQQSVGQLRQGEQLLRKKIQELNQTKSAALNVLEDLEVEKNKVASERSRDQAILSSIGDALLIIASDGKIEFMNTIAQQLLGISPGTGVGDDWQRVFQIADHNGRPIPPNHTDVHKGLRDGRLTRDAKQMLYQHTRRRWFPAVITIAPIKQHGTTIGVVIVFHDATREYEVDKAKTEFVSLAAHQLRSPLSTISWYTEILLTGEVGRLAKKQEPYLQEIHGASHRMTDLVNALLNVSRIEAGSFSVDATQVDMVEQVKIILRELQPQVDQKKQVLKTKFEHPKMVISADLNLFRIIMQNVITNAVKYSPDGATISVAVQSVQSGEQFGNKRISQDAFGIQVTDTGYGIPEEQQRHIFTKLFRADNIREKDTSGTGLGLYLVKSIMEAVGGEIYFTSQVNKGTSFYVVLPKVGMRSRKGTKRLMELSRHS